MRGTSDNLARVLKEVAEANRGLSATVPPRPDPASYGAPCSAQRVVQAGGALSQLLMHPSFTPFEVLFRRLPEEGVFEATPQRNFRFELGAFAVPSRMSFVFVDYRFDIFRLSGAVAGDFVPLEERRLADRIGYDVKINDYRKGNLRYELDPRPIQIQRQDYQGQQRGGTTAFGPLPFVPPPGAGPAAPTPAQFAGANFARASTPAGTGNALLPQRTQRQGPLPLPFTYVAEGDQRVAFDVVVFKPIPIPLAFFEVSVTGLLIPANLLSDMLEGMRPCSSPGGGR